MIKDTSDIEPNSKANSFVMMHWATNCKVKSVIMEAFNNAAFLCEEYYDTAPDIELKGVFRKLL